MEKTLIIAEKPSLAKNIMNAIGINSFSCRDGYYENEEYIVSWAFGHLLALIDIEDYESCPPRKSKYSWTMEGLPFFPEEFEFQLRKDRKSGKVDSGGRKQFKVLQVLIKRKDVGIVVHAGDADREGEVIIRNICIMRKTGSR